jgi:hypothetical protein
MPFEAARSGTQSYIPSFRPIDIIHAFGRTWATTKSGGAFAGISRVEYNTSDGKVNLLPWVTLPCARRVASDGAYLYVTQMSFFCGGKDWSATLGSGIVSLVKPNSPSESAILVGNLLNPDGIVVHDDVLYAATANDASTELGNRIVRVQNLRAQADAKWADPSYSVVVDTMVHFNHKQGWHPTAALSLSPDGKFLLVSRANACNHGCHGDVKAVEIATRKVYKFADGLRNPAAIYAYDPETVLISDMGSDAGLGTTQFATKLGVAGGENGPSDRVVAVKWVAPTVEYAPPPCIDDPNNVILYADPVASPQIAGGCEKMTADGGCDGSFLFPGFEFFQVSVNIGTECPFSCGICPSAVSYT